MVKKPEYKIILDTVGAAEQRMNELAQEGWHALGPAYYAGKALYVVTMVRVPD
ncbi:MAG: hypothetical protein ACYTFQ_00340 [Planctomycetota bacterium]|jgi:hypothetical protein